MTTQELDHRVDVSRKMRICFHDDGLISQFEGYDRLDELDWLDYQERYGDIQRLDRDPRGRGDSTNRYKVSKQADVLVVFYLLPPTEVREISTGSAIRSIRTPTWANVEYYLARISRVHALVGGALLGAGPTRPAPLVGPVPPSPAQQHRRHPGRHDARGSTSAPWPGPST